MRFPLALLAAFALAAACARKDQRSHMADAKDAMGLTTTTADDRRVTACQGIDSVGEACLYRVAGDLAACGGERCEKLAIYFSGGQMTCPDPKDARRYLGAYNARGYIAVCARLFESSDGASKQAFVDEARRVETLLRTITAAAEVRKLWTGDDLLVTGVSHGATAPVVAMARKDFDEGAKLDAWKGRRRTGACFLDGIYDAREQLQFSHDNKCGRGNSLVTYQRFYGRYCSWPKRARLPAFWPEPSDCGSPGIAADTIEGDGAAHLGIKDWKLVECGSAKPACNGDIVPAAPIQRLCNTIGGMPGHSCEYASYPQTGHINCGGSEETIATCADWFDSLSN